MDERETVKRFVDCAERFCSLIEHHQSLTAGEFVRSCASCLADLYGASVSLSLLSVEIDSAELIADVISTERARAIDRQISEKLNGQCLYWEVLDPRIESDPIVDGLGVGDLADDIADIYREVKNGLFAFNRGPATEAIWHWQEGFRSHWGDHVVDALRGMHHIVRASLK